MYRVEYFEMVAGEPEPAIAFHTKLFVRETLPWEGPQNDWLITAESNHSTNTPAKWMGRR